MPNPTPDNQEEAMTRVPEEAVAVAVAPRGRWAYRGKAGCQDVRCTQDGSEDRCYGWHCGLCGAPSNCQADCTCEPDTEGEPDSDNPWEQLERERAKPDYQYLLHQEECAHGSTLMKLDRLRQGRGAERENTQAHIRACESIVRGLTERAERAESALKLAKQDEHDAEQLLFASESALTRLLGAVRAVTRQYRSRVINRLRDTADEIERSLGGPNASAEPEAQLADGKGAPADPPDKLARPPADVTRGGGVSGDAVAPSEERVNLRLTPDDAAELYNLAAMFFGCRFSGDEDCVCDFCNLRRWFSDRGMTRNPLLDGKPYRVNERSDEDG